jgi:hypothetical protein
MNPRRAILWALCSVVVVACDPSDACDHGYRADHGYCYLIDAGYDPLTDGSAGADEDGGDAAPLQNPNAKFGSPCSQQSDCGGEAPVCGGPMLPVCTQINCMEGGQNTCPNGWDCIDVSKYMPAPGVITVCIDL